MPLYSTVWGIILYSPGTFRILTFPQSSSIVHSPDFCIFFDSVSLVGIWNTVFLLLKGQCHEIFCLRFFSWITFPQAPVNNIRIISNFFLKIRGDICKSRCTTGVNNTGEIATGVNDTYGKFATGINETSGKFCHQFPLCCWHRGQIMGTISGCWHLKVNLKAKIYTYVSSTTQWWPKKTIKIFLIEDFSHLPPVSTTPVVNLELRISPWIFEKIRNGFNGILWGWGETDSWKKPEAKNLMTLSL